MIVFPATFDQSCSFQLAPCSLAAIKKGLLKIRVRQHGGNSAIKGFVLNCAAKSGSITIFVGADGAEVQIGNGVAGNYDIRLWKNSSIRIGDETTCNEGRFICQNSSIDIGRDCMFSDQIIIQSADQHGIVDLVSGSIVNDGFKKVMIGDHVWLGRAVSIMHGAEIGSGSIVGFGSLVNKQIPDNSLAVGVPAEVVKREVTWTRSPTKLDLYSSKEVEKYRQAMAG